MMPLDLETWRSLATFRKNIPVAGERSWWDLKGLGGRKGCGSSYFLTWLPQHLTLTLSIYWITFPFFGSYEAHFTSPQIPSWAPCSLLTFKCQGFQGSVFSPCLCLMLKLSHSWWFQWCLPLGDPTLLSPALDSPQASDPFLAPPVAHGDSSGLQQAHLSGTQLTSHHQKSPPQNLLPNFQQLYQPIKEYNPKTS